MQERIKNDLASTVPQASSELFILKSNNNNNLTEAFRTVQAGLSQVRAHLQRPDLLLPGLQEHVDAEALQHLGGFDEGCQVLPAVGADNTPLRHRPAEREQRESVSRLRRPQQELGRPLQEPGVPTRSNLGSGPEEAAPVVFKEVQAGQRALLLFVLHDRQAAGERERERDGLLRRKWSCLNRRGSESQRVCFLLLSK